MSAIVPLTMVGTLLWIALPREGAVLIESRESKTKTGGPVYNRIQWFSFPNQDVWLMQQSHGGLGAKSHPWERLAIVVDKHTSPKRARFYQLEPGPLEWKEGLAVAEYRVSCFICHPNGPRAIRPELDSPQVPLSLRDKVRIALWNVRIKTYGRIVTEERDLPQGPPFRLTGQLENEPLLVRACTRCHRESGLIARGFLTRQNAMAIDFMVSMGYMPPKGFRFSEREKKAVREFIEGF